jgi:hypothetical protein
MLFANISNLNSISDYIPIITSATIVDLCVMFITLNYAKSKYLKKWYHNYHIGAVIADVLSASLGILIARYIYYYIFTEFSLLKFILVVVVVQICHDILFYILFSLVPRGKSPIMDLFQDYAKELGGFAIFGDSLIVIFTTILASLLASLSFQTNLFIFVWSLYLVPYFVFSF